MSWGQITFKMHKGHRGINHPVKNLITGKCEITSQNHGFGVKAEEIKKVKTRQKIWPFKVKKCAS